MRAQIQPVFRTAGNFTGALGVADVLHWTDAAAGAWPLRFVPPAVFESAQVDHLAFEAHHYGVWLPDFWCAPFAADFPFVAEFSTKPSQC